MLLGEFFVALLGAVVSLLFFPVLHPRLLRIALEQIATLESILHCTKTVEISRNKGDEWVAQRGWCSR